MMSLEEEIKLFYEVVALLEADEPSPEVAAIPAAAQSMTPSAPAVAPVGISKKLTPSQKAFADFAIARRNLQADKNPNTERAYQDAWGQAYMAVYDKLVDRAAKLFGQDAEDVVGEKLSNPDFINKLADIGDQIHSGNTEANPLAFATTAIRNAGLDFKRKQREKALGTGGGGEEDEPMDTPVTSKADTGDTPDEAVEKAQQFELAKKKWREITGQDWTPGAEAAPAEPEVQEPPVEAPEQPAEAPVEDPSVEAPTEEPAPEKKAPRGKRAAAELPPMSDDQLRELIKHYSAVPKSRGKPVSYGGRDYGILTGRGDNVLTDPAHIEKILTTHLFDKDKRREDPLHHKEVHGLHGAEIDADKVKKFGKDLKTTGAGNATAKQIQSTLAQFKKFIPIHLGLADTVDKMGNRAVPLTRLKQDLDAASAALAADPENPEKQQAVQLAQTAFDTESQEIAKMKEASRTAHKEFFQQHGNEAARQSIAKAEKVSKTKKAPTKPATGELQHLQRQVNAATSAVQAHPEDPQKQQALASTQQAFDAEHAKREAEKGGGTPAPEAVPAEVPVAAPKAKPPADEPLDPEYEAQRAAKFKKFERTPLSKYEQPERRGPHHVIGDLADAEHEFEGLPDEEKHAMHPSGRALADKIHKLHREYRSLRPSLGGSEQSAGAPIARQAGALKTLRNPPSAPAIPDENAEPEVPPVDAALHGLEPPMEARSLAGRIVSEDTYVICERIAKFLKG